MQITRVTHLRANVQLMRGVTRETYSSQVFTVAANLITMAQAGGGPALSTPAFAPLNFNRFIPVQAPEANKSEQNGTRPLIQ